MKNKWELSFEKIKGILRIFCFAFIITTIISLFISKDLISLGNNKNEIL